MAGYQINPDNNFGKSMKSVRFFNTYFANFKYLLISNICYLIFILVAICYVYITVKLIGSINIIAALGAIVFLNIGMGGLCPVVRYVYLDKEFSPVKTFFKGVKENFGKFFIHGVFFYLFTAISYSSVALYFSGTKRSSVFWIPLIITGLISLLLLFASYYLNIMTISIDIGLKDIYRNCLLFSFGELKNNLLATAALLVLSAVVFSAVFIANRLLYVLIILGVLAAFILPSTIQYILTFYLYEDMESILNKDKKSDDSEESLHSPRTQLDKAEAEEISKLAPDSNDEYVFHNGKMIKRSLIQEQLDETFDDEIE